VPLNPAVTLITPAEGSSVEVGSAIALEVALQDAAGFGTTLNGVSNAFSGTTGTLAAPATAGSYVLTVTAQDQQGTNLNATDTATLTVIEAPSSAISCDVGPADSWPTGFVINNVTVTNLNATAISNWTVEITFSHDFEFGNGWGGEFTSLGRTLTVSNVEYNGNLASGQSTSFGFQGGLSTALVAPTCVAK
jgi:cellulase/cellobiase CelA1